MDVRSSTARIITVCVAVIALAACSAAAAAQLSGPRERHSLAREKNDDQEFRVRFTNVGPLPTIGTPVCDATRHCVFPGSETGTYHGDFEGTHVASGGAALDTTGTRFTTTRVDLFVGTIKRCGTGTVVLRLIEDATATSGTGTWTVAAGFGTGALRGVKGHGTGEGTVGPAGIQSTLTGKIECKR